MAPALRQVVSTVRGSAARIMCLSLAKSSVRGSAPDRVQVWVVGRQEQQVRAGLADGTASALPLIWPGAREPVSRWRLRHFDTQDGLIRRAAAISRIVSPASARCTAR